MTEQEFIKKIGTWAREDMGASGVLASITIAQAILESGWGTTELATQANNYFGMKTNLSGNTWNSVWDGVSKYTKNTQEQDESGNAFTIQADFRKYSCALESIRDHSCYLTGAMAGNTLRYVGLVGERDYRKGIQIIKDGGYATDVEYVSKICRIIQKYNLTEYDKEVVKLQKVTKYQTKNGAYTSGKTITVKGAVLHSYGCPQPNPDVLARAWDNPSANACVHEHIGKDKVIVTLPCAERKGIARRGWHVGSGTKGSGNNTHLSAEMTEPATIKYTSGSNWIECGDGSGTKSHVLATYKNAVHEFAEWCSFHGLDPLADGVILSHSEAYARGIASNHGDVEHIWRRFGLSMDQFRKDIKAAMSGNLVDFGPDVSETDTSGQSVNCLSGTVMVTYVGTDGLNVRVSPSYKSDIDCAVYKGELFTVVGISADEKWYKLSSGLFITAIPDYVQFKATEGQKESTTDTGYFRVRISWKDAGSQIGAFKTRDNAVELCKQNIGYKVFDDTGSEVYPCTTNEKKEIQVRIASTELRIRKGPGTSYDYQKIGGKAVYTGQGVFTIVETHDGPGASQWGLLQSYAGDRNGWISMDFAEKL